MESEVECEQMLNCYVLNGMLNMLNIWVRIEGVCNEQVLVDVEFE